MAKKFNLSDYIEADPERSNLNQMEITPIPLGMIDTNWKNFYSVDFQEVDLAESIKISGLLTPLDVIAGPGGRWKLISGHRRYRALRYLRDTEPDGRERWDTVPCVVFPSPEDADREELMLIHANAQRIKNGSEIAKEAEKTLQILTRMKERGVELPGRMRDRVAEALQVSSARLARLDAIKKNLTYPGWVRAWEKQEINEAVAYRLSQLDYSQQMNAADWVIDHNIAHKDVTVKNIEDALAANALDAAIEGATTGGAPLSPAEPDSSPAGGAEEAPDPMTATAVTVSDRVWRSCVNDPPEGWALAFMLSTWNVAAHDHDIHLVQFHDGKWWGVYDEANEDIDVDLWDWWTPAPAVPPEVWEEDEG